MKKTLLPPLTSRGLRHLPLRSSPNSPFLKGLILTCLMRPPVSVPASLADLHLSSQASTRARGARTQLRGVPPRDPCRYVTFLTASNSLVQSSLLTLTLRGAVVMAVSERHSPPSGAMHSLPPDLAPTPLSSLRRRRARHHAAHFSMLSTPLPPFPRARL